MFSLPVRTRPSPSTPQPAAPAAQEPSTPSNGSEMDLIRLPARSQTASQQAQAIIKPFAQDAFSPSNGSEISLTIRNHPAVRGAVASIKTASDYKIVITLSNRKSKAKKNASAAPMLNKKGKVVKKDSKTCSKKGKKGKKVRKAKTPSKHPLIHRIAGKVSSSPSLYGC